MTLKPLTCPNCGGRVNEARCVCEYCGTQFKSDEPDIGVFRVEHFTLPTRVLGMESRIDNEYTALDSDLAIKYAKREIAEQLADKLLQGELIEFRSEMDMLHCQQIISARLRVLDPHYRF